MNGFAPHPQGDERRQNRGQPIAGRCSQASDGRGRQAPTKVVFAARPQCRQLAQSCTSIGTKPRRMIACLANRLGWRLKAAAQARRSRA